MEDKKDEQQPNLPTIRESRTFAIGPARGIESQIWKIAKKACRFLIKRIEARENAGKPRKLTVEFVKTGEAEAAEKDTGGGLNVDPERKHER